MDPPSGVSNVKKVDFYFNTTSFVKGRNSSDYYSATSPVAGDTRTITPGSSFPIKGMQITCTFSVDSDGKICNTIYSGYIYSYCSSNIALTYYY